MNASPKSSGTKTRFGVVGAGLWGSFHCKTLNALPEAELTAVCDLDPKRVQAMQDQFGARKAYTDYRELIADDDIEAITVATPDFAHGDIVMAALAAGKHVLSEKPLATTLAEAEKIAALAAKTNAKVMVDFHNRVNPAVHAMKEAISAEKSGCLCMPRPDFPIRCSCLSSFSAGRPNPRLCGSSAAMPSMPCASRSMPKLCGSRP